MCASGVHSFINLISYLILVGAQQDLIDTPINIGLFIIQTPALIDTRINIGLFIIQIPVPRWQKVDIEMPYILGLPGTLSWLCARSSMDRIYVRFYITTTKMIF